MSKLLSIYNSSVGKKFIVGFTGLFLCSFLIVHVGGNLLVYKNDGGASYQTFCDFMAGNVIIRALEIVLFAGFIFHILTSTLLWFRNKRARQTKYLVNKPLENSSFTSRITFLTGSIIFIFLVIHMDSFWVTSRFQEESLAQRFRTEAVQQEPSSQQEYLQNRDTNSPPLPVMYKLVQEKFASPLYDAFYLVALLLLAFHLRHGFQSAFQTFGIRGMRYAGLIEAVGVLFWLIIPLVFATMPIYFFFFKHS